MPDIYSILQEYDEQKDKDAAKEEEQKNKSMAEQLTEAVVENKAQQIAVRDMTKGGSGGGSSESADKAEEVVKHRETELGKGNKDIQSVEYQEKLAKKLYNALSSANAQKTILMNNRQNTQRGIAKDYSSAKSYNPRSGTKPQSSRVDIPTYLIDKIRNEIGSTSFQLTNEATVIGFIYWYFGIDVDEKFDQDKTDKIQEVIDLLNFSASPSKSIQENKEILEKISKSLSMISDSIEVIKTNTKSMATKLGQIEPDVSKTKYAIFYNILNMLAFAPIIMPGDTLEDVDFLSEGSAWTMDQMFDKILNYVNDVDGREAYKNQIRLRKNQYEYKRNQKLFDDSYKNIGRDESQAEYENQEYEESAYEESNYEDVDVSDLDFNMFDVYEYQADGATAGTQNAMERAKLKKQLNSKLNVNSIVTNTDESGASTYDPYANSFFDDDDDDGNDDQ